MPDYNDDFKAKVVNYKLNGHTTQETFEKFNVPVRTIQKWQAKILGARTTVKGEPKILIWDVETSESISAHYQLWNTNIRPDRVLHPSFMFCAAWKWYGEKKIHDVSLLDDMKRFKKNCFDIRKLHFDDYHVIKTLHGVLDEADVFVYHNGDKFDLKKFNARAIYHGLKPISPNKIKIDTLKIARQNFAFESNSLNYLCDYLDIQGKVKTPKGMFEGALMLDEKCLKMLVKYNRGDISPSLEQLFERFSPYIKNFNLNLFTNGYHCSKPACGSADLEFKGFKYTKATRRREMQCKACGGFEVVKNTDRGAEIRPC